MSYRLLTVALATLLLAACGKPPATTAVQSESQAAGPAAADDVLQTRAAALFRPLPAVMTDENRAVTEAQIDLGRMLYFDARLSKNQEISCNTCHDLERYGVDGEPTSSGHKGQRGARNSPTVYNAALHIAQFWDGRADDVEEQAQGPVLNPVEMAMPDAAAVEKVLKSIPGYAPAFAAAFPDDADPISFKNAADAIGAFERGLVTPSPFDRYLVGETSALSAEQIAGLETFMDVGCTTCHNGVGIGGGLYQKLGLIKPFETEDTGRAEVTGSEVDKFMFKVPSLRNIVETAPYFHDGKVVTLDEAIRLMAEHQLGRTLTDEQVASIASFLGSLTGELPAEYIAMPALPESGPGTPQADQG